MNNAASIIERCQSQGIVLALADDGSLDLTPKAAVTNDLRAQIKANYKEIVKALEIEGMNWSPRMRSTRMQVMEVETPVSAADLIARCHRNGISLSANGDQIQITRSRKTAFPHELRNALVENKVEILALLAADESDAQQNNAARKPLSLHWLDT